MVKWECSVCAYIYDPEKGDSISGIAPGTTSEELQDDRAGPACGANKDASEKFE